MGVVVEKINKDDSDNDQKEYQPPLKEKNISQEKKEKKNNQKRKIKQTNFIEEESKEEPLILSKSSAQEDPLILDNIKEEKEIVHKKISKEKINYSPAARKLAKESKIDTSNLKGTGKNGVVLKEDVMSLMGVKPKPSQRKVSHGPEERIKNDQIKDYYSQKRLKEAQENAAMLTTFNEVDMHEVILMKNFIKNNFKINIL